MKMKNNDKPQYEILTTAVANQSFPEGELEASLEQRLPHVQEYLALYYKTVSAQAKEQYPDSVHLDHRGIAILKQNVKFHSYSVLVHGAIAFGIAQKVLGQNPQVEKNNSKEIFFNEEISTNLLRQIEAEKTSNEEALLRSQTLEETIKLTTALALTNTEKLLMALGAAMHDTGKYAEREIKNMENVPERIGTIRIKQIRTQRQFLKNPFYEDRLKSGVFAPPQGPSDHVQDELTIKVYQDLYQNGLLSGTECNALIEVHEAFTQLSIGRYAKNIQPKEFLTSLGDPRTTCKAVIMLAIDEIAKGNRFIKNEEAQSNRIGKFKYLLTLMAIAKQLIAA
jgi:hypothetical protein